MNITIKDTFNNEHIATTARCPQCGREAVFKNLAQNDINVGGGIVCGQRQCPDPKCRGHLFVVFKNGELVASYPTITINFDADNIPEKIKKTFEEALACHAAGCSVAAAIMVRRTLEAICDDKSASGDDLKGKLADLQTKIVLPQELLDAMYELRLLGEDAAQVGAKDFESISAEELEAAIEATKEIMKGLYQYSTLLKKLRSVKKG